MDLEFSISELILIESSLEYGLSEILSNTKPEDKEDIQRIAKRIQQRILNIRKQKGW